MNDSYLTDQEQKPKAQQMSGKLYLPENGERDSWLYKRQKREDERNHAEITSWFKEVPHCVKY